MYKSKHAPHAYSFIYQCYAQQSYNSIVKWVATLTIEHMFMLAKLIINENFTAWQSVPVWQAGTPYNAKQTRGRVDMAQLGCWTMVQLAPSPRPSS